MDYLTWDWFGGGERVTYDWDHDYGPLEWPRDGTTLLNVKSDRPHYWKAETLDRFDGFGWRRSRDNANTSASVEIPKAATPPGREWRYFQRNPSWDERSRFTVRSLRSDFVLGAGNTYAVKGVRGVALSADGTTLALGEPLEEGHGYEARVYAPNPTAEQMRRAPACYPDSLRQYTSFFLADKGDSALERDGLSGDASRSAAPPGRAVSVPLRGDPSDAGSEGWARRIRASAYGRMYRLSRRLAAGRPTTYDAAKAVERFLKRRYVCSERPPSQEIPLAAFLFEDQIGYCQQFSGAMALMLRMNGIPARVATGFAPGSLNRDTGEYRVRDLDAHSWVELNFTGIGWVPFDPTPAASPALSGRSAGEVVLSASDPGGGRRDALSGGSERGLDPRTAPGSGDGGGAPWWSPAAGLALLGLAAAAVVRFRHRRGRETHGPDARAEAQLRGLESALTRLGFGLPAGTTLLALERRLARVAGPGSAGYAAGLRAARFEARSPGPPGPHERRLLRRELARGAGGLRARLRALRAIPPGGPRAS